MPKIPAFTPKEEEVFEDIVRACKEKDIEHYKNEAIFLYLASIEGNSEIISELSSQKGTPVDWLKIVMIVLGILAKNKHQDASKFLQNTLYLKNESYEKDIFNLLNIYSNYLSKFKNNIDLTIILTRINKLMEKIGSHKTSAQSQELIIDTLKIFLSWPRLKESAIYLIQDYFCILTGIFVKSINDVISRLADLNISPSLKELILNFYQDNPQNIYTEIKNRFALKHPKDKNITKAIALYVSIKNNDWNYFRFPAAPENDYILSFVIEQIYIFENQDFRISLLQHLRELPSQEIISNAYKNLHSTNFHKSATNLLNEYVDNYIYYQNHHLELTFLNLVAFFGPRQNDDAMRMLAWQLKIANNQDQSSTQNLIYSAYDTLETLHYTEEATRLIALYTGNLILDDEYFIETDIMNLLEPLEQLEQDILVNLILNRSYGIIVPDNTSDTNTLVDEYTSSPQVDGLGLLDDNSNFKSF